MDIGNLFFYGIIAVSVVSSIVKSVKKRPEENENTGMPDFKGSNAGKWMRTILEDIGEKEDDFIPTNPEPVTKKIEIPDTKKNEAESRKRAFSAASFATTKNTTHKTDLYQKPDIKQEKQEDISDSVLLSLDLSNVDELKKAIIYSEIIRPKF